MGEYFECEVKRNNEDETFVATVSLRLLPRIGEHIKIATDQNVYSFKVTDIWHFVAGSQGGHIVQIYVDWA
ncbi:hypothetical protein C7R93_16930 [Brevibacillus fortis]|uniref:Uncharacterized protein n=1 Tax=Brevibacillus fortis TaxID=2126352 RepID=A0A2P7V3P1_9BACL|nr:hypothetical protein C7R93_16930 [Brevibacillus fortis]